MEGKETSSQENEGTEENERIPEEEDHRQVGMEEQTPKDNDSKEDNAFVKSFEGKKYFWCTNHNNGAGMWTLYQPKDCETGKASTGTTAKAHIATFDTVDSNADME